MTDRPKRMYPARNLLLARVAIAIVGLAVAWAGGCKRSKTPAAGDSAAEQQTQPAEEKPTTVEAVLEATAAAYQKASSYADLGMVRLSAVVGGETVDQRVKYTIAMVRPNKIRIEAHQVTFVSDGRQIRAAIPDRPNQVLARPAPAELTIESIYTDRGLAAALRQVFGGGSPRLALLLADDPLATILSDAEQTALGEPGEIDNRPCYRVKVTRPDGITVYWIDRESYVLRQIVLPTGPVRQMLERAGAVESLSLVAELAGAQLGRRVDPTAFEFEVPEGADLVDSFELPEGALVEEQEIPRPDVAEQTAPETFKLIPLWKCTELKAPGNVLVVGQGGARSRLLVVDAWKSVAEVDLSGKLIANHQLEIDPSEVINAVRTGVAADGKRYFVVFALASAQQRVHLLDESFKLLVHYPEHALERESRHSGIADVQFGDLDGDGTPEICLGYFGVVGVQGASLTGERLWSNRSISNVLKIAFGPPDAQRRRNLLCVNTSGRLAVIDPQGGRQTDVILPNRALHWIASADFEGNGRLDWCGMAGIKMGENIAVGLNLTGDELWSYALPEGVHQQPIERIIPARLAPRSRGHWILPGPDGSIHLVAPDGKLLDRFNYGATLAGLAVTELAGRPVLLVSSPNGLEAWKVD